VKNRLLATKRKVRKKLSVLAARWYDNPEHRFILIPGEEDEDFPGYRIVRIISLLPHSNIHPQLLLPDGSPRLLRPGDLSFIDGALWPTKYPKYSWDLVVPADVPLAEATYYLYRNRDDPKRVVRSALECNWSDPGAIRHVLLRKVQAILAAPDNLYIKDNIHKCCYRLAQCASLPIYVLYDVDGFLVFDVDKASREHVKYFRFESHDATCRLTPKECATFADPAKADSCELFWLTQQIAEQYNAQLGDPYVDVASLSDVATKYTTGSAAGLADGIRMLAYAVVPEATWILDSNAAEIAVRTEQPDQATHLETLSIFIPKRYHVAKFLVDSHHEHITKILAQNNPYGYTVCQAGGDPRKLKSYHLYSQTIELHLNTPSSHEKLSAILRLNAWCKKYGMPLPQSGP
jgi:hypothetical protein